MSDCRKEKMIKVIGLILSVIIVGLLSYGGYTAFHHLTSNPKNQTEITEGYITEKSVERGVLGEYYYVVKVSPDDTSEKEFQITKEEYQDAKIGDYYFNGEILKDDAEIAAHLWER